MRATTILRLNAVTVGYALLVLSAVYFFCSLILCTISGFCLFGLLSPAVGIGLVLGSLILFAYLVAYEVALANWKRRLENLRGDIQHLQGKDKDRFLDVSRRGREQSMIAMGSLFIPTAFVLLGAAATSSEFISQSARVALAASAPVLYVLWLFLVQLSTRLMDDVDSDMRLIANDGAARVLHDFYQDRHGFGLMMWLRRNHWLAYVPLLTLGATLIIQSIIIGKPP
ncbi:MAG: hypothetical protein ABSF00_02910 [Candidatus Bathyarchaeia archaeon]